MDIIVELMKLYLEADEETKHRLDEIVGVSQEQSLDVREKHLSTLE